MWFQRIFLFVFKKMHFPVLRTQGSQAACLPTCFLGRLLVCPGGRDDRYTGAVRDTASTASLGQQHFCPYFPAMCFFRGVPWGPRLIRVPLPTQTARVSLFQLHHDHLCPPQPVGCPAPSKASPSLHPPASSLSQIKTTPGWAQLWEMPLPCYPFHDLTSILCPALLHQNPAGITSCYSLPRTCQGLPTAAQTSRWSPHLTY